MHENKGLAMMFIEGVAGTILMRLIFSSSALTQGEVMFFGSMVFVLMILVWALTVIRIEYGQLERV